MYVGTEADRVPLVINELFCLEKGELRVLLGLAFSAGQRGQFSRMADAKTPD